MQIRTSLVFSPEHEAYAVQCQRQWFFRDITFFFVKITATRIGNLYFG